MLSIGRHACGLPLHTPPGSNPVQVAMFQRVDRGGHLLVVSIEIDSHHRYENPPCPPIFSILPSFLYVFSLSPAVILHKIQIKLESSGASLTNGRHKRTQLLSVCSKPSPTDDGVLDGVLCSHGDYFPTDFIFSSIRSAHLMLHLLLNHMFHGAYNGRPFHVIDVNFIIL
ncbi:hypothetical protein EJB05_29830 [Eragrostis curvula]|uniref:Uncharacterized protein n=1 Tax=Eragrostis curvula TaxID=38414 RepID=A0A5J9UU13_9POAL|nr:hypothetical protein EJB05_29830 [Eragrostis curvula]